jgi:hypothetical protein
MFKHISTSGLTGLFAFSLVMAIEAQEFRQQASESRPETGVQSAANLRPATEVVQKSITAFELKPTAVAPAGASGYALLKGPRMSLHLSQLGPGKYEVVAISRAGRVPYPLGVIAIIDPTSSPSRQANDNKKEASAHPESVSIVTDTELILPTELPPIAILRVVGQGGNAVLETTAK